MLKFSVNDFSVARAFLRKPFEKGVEAVKSLNVDDGRAVEG